ncbi:DUF4129 domain-containing protein [Brachybacterium rhamnosum]|uniref:DUF4129 domain-containing protein n=1 Tax=Brachybacterium rhamnosum TaxID=173361 RepID=A0ABW4PX32_9MICO
MTAPGRAPRRRALAPLLVLLGVLALAMLALGAGADRGTIALFDGQERTAPPPPAEGQAYEEPEWATEDQPTIPPPMDPMSRESFVRILVVLGVIAAALVALVAYRMWRLAPERLRGAGEVEDEEGFTTEQARDALAEARRSLSTVVSAHDAVIAAWLALERAIGRAGVSRAPSQTTLEYVVAVLGALALDAAALDELAGLYRRALFDPHPLVEADRDRALLLLERLESQLQEAP